jgi:putative hydrolase of the HAD superfamily
MIDGQLFSNDRTIVFDLDDTLYAEADYVQSGKAAVTDMAYELFGVDFSHDVAILETGFLDYIAEKLGGHAGLKESLLWTYRLHHPKIQVRVGVKELITGLKTRGDSVAIITDGRSVTQRLKIAALELDVEHIFISDEIGFEKPDPAAFLAVENRCATQAYVYVGDNVHKDFDVPRNRGWLSVGLRHDERAIHALHVSAQEHVQPDIWVDNIEMLSALLLGDNA